MTRTMSMVLASTALAGLVGVSRAQPAPSDREVVISPPPPRGPATVMGWFVDDAGVHALSWSDPEQRRAFAAACTRWVRDAERCDVERMRIGQPGWEHDLEVSLRRAVGEERKISFNRAYVMIVPQDYELTFADPTRAAGADVHPMAALAGWEAPAVLRVHLAVALSGERDSGEFVTVLLDPHDLQVTHAFRTGSWVSGRPLRLGTDSAARPHGARGALAHAWARMAADEDLAAEAFRRHIRELVAVGAPPSLIARAERARWEEVEHRNLCLQVAASLSGRRVHLGPRPSGPPERRGLGEILAGVAGEGCLNETVSFGVLRAVLAHTTDPHHHAILAAITEQERSHAALAWDTLAWGLPRLPAADAREVLGQLTADADLPVYAGLGVARIADLRRAVGALRSDVAWVGRQLADA
jgi:hypothetical protein